MLAQKAASNGIPAIRRFGPALLVSPKKRSLRQVLTEDSDVVITP